MTPLHFGDGDDDDTKGDDDNKNSADPGDINRLSEDIGERVGKTDHKPHEDTL